MHPSAQSPCRNKKTNIALRNWKTAIELFMESLALIDFVNLCQFFFWFVEAERDIRSIISITVYALTYLIIDVIVKIESFT